MKLDSFDSKSQQELTRRSAELQQISPEDQTLDPARQQRMQDRLKQQGPTQEPIIALPNAQGLELIEGWHRTQQSLFLFTEYPARIWAGYA